MNGRVLAADGRCRTADSQAVARGLGRGRTRLIAQDDSGRHPRLESEATDSRAVERATAIYGVDGYPIAPRNIDSATR